MSLDFGGVPNNLFKYSEETNEGINSKGLETFYSSPATIFVAAGDVLDYSGDSGTIEMKSDGINLGAPLHLPNGTVINACVVYGNAGATAETWELERIGITSPTSTTIASANIGTEDKSILNVSTVENDKYTYNIVTTSLDTGDIVYSIKITYTK